MSKITLSYYRVKRSDTKLAIAQIRSTIAPLDSLKEDVTLYTAAVSKLLEERKVKSAVRALRKLDVTITNTIELCSRRGEEAIKTVSSFDEVKDTSFVSFTCSSSASPTCSTPKKETLNISKVKYFEILLIFC